MARLGGRELHLGATEKIAVKVSPYTIHTHIAPDTVKSQGCAGLQASNLSQGLYN
ncbi:MAG: hypothetical protein RIM23_27465 [Coleofasciculus sp. G3-WIS-01]|uniref:hypothetical protein n=1 Tax=Coleofasciculus sp. G3-WIS-01 TaxID=3069528 RepID=UPI0032F5E182